MKKCFAFKRGYLRSLLLIALCLCVTFSYASPFSFAEEPGPEELTLNHSGLFFEKLSLSGNKLSVGGVPSGSEYSYLMLVLKDRDGKDVYKDVCARGADGTVSFRLSGFPAGNYLIDIYRAPELYTTYDSVLYNDSLLVWTGDGGHFEAPPALSLNASRLAAPVDGQSAADFYLKSSPYVQSEDPAVKELAASLASGSAGAYETAKRIHDWVCQNIYYDFDALYGKTPFTDNSASGVLTNRRAVCEGYANLSIALLRAAGIPARRVEGYALGITSYGWPEGIFSGVPVEGNHVWLEAYIDYRWVIIDPTWDCGNEYKDGKIAASEGITSYRYFDISQEFFAFDHAATAGERFASLGAASCMYLYINNPRMLTPDGWKDLDSSGTAPVIRNGRTLVPIALIISEMGGKVEWTPATATTYAKVSCEINGHFVEMWINYDKYYIDGEEYVFDVPPQIINQRTMIPLRGLLEPLGCEIQWEANVEGWPGRVTISYYR